MPTFALISDLHSHDVPTPRADVLIAAGDMTNHGTEEEFVQFNHWLAKQPQDLKLYVPGNHDTLAYTNTELVKQILTHAHTLIDSAMCIDGVKLWASPWVRSDDTKWAFPLMIGSEKSEKKWLDIPEGLDLLITHGPPVTISDRNWQHHNHVGDPFLLRRLLALKQPPRVHVFGHIHEGERVTHKHGIAFLNAAVVDQHTKVTKAPLLLGYHAGAWTLNEGEHPTVRLHRQLVNS